MQTICTSLQTDNHTNIPSLNFLQTRCSSWRKTNEGHTLHFGKEINRSVNGSWVYFTAESILCDPIQPNPLAYWPVEKFGPNPIQLRNDRFSVPVRSAVNSNLTAWCDQILSNRDLSQSFQNFSTFTIVDPVHLYPRKIEKSLPNPTQPNPRGWVGLGWVGASLAGAGYSVAGGRPSYHSNCGRVDRSVWKFPPNDFQE